MNFNFVNTVFLSFYYITWLYYTKGCVLLLMLINKLKINQKFIILF